MRKWRDAEGLKDLAIWGAEVAPKGTQGSQRLLGDCPRENLRDSLSGFITVQSTPAHLPKWHLNNWGPNRPTFSPILSKVN